MFERMKEDIQAVFDRDPAARSLAEVLLCYPGLHAIWAHRVAHRLWTRGHRLTARALSQSVRFLTGVEIHPGASLGRRFFIDHGMGVVIGETAEVGDDCTIYHQVTLGGTSWRKEKRHPTLGNNVVIGAGAKVLGPHLVGENSKIGAGSVVVAPVPPASSVVGVPGRVTLKRETADKDHYDINHTDIPDPVVKALECIAAQVTELDAEVRRLKKAGGRGRKTAAGRREIKVLEGGKACMEEAGK
ncbi:MAG: serine O-acetyltransferase [Deltaproteobacteria bacterium]|nr:serine O-acetyltransferase [Deltaproteobacteria bacterium]